MESETVPLSATRKIDLCCSRCICRCCKPCGYAHFKKRGENSPQSDQTEEGFSSLPCSGAEHSFAAACAVRRLVCSRTSSVPPLVLIIPLLLPILVPIRTLLLFRILLIIPIPCSSSSSCSSPSSTAPLSGECSLQSWVAEGFTSTAKRSRDEN